MKRKKVELVKFDSGGVLVDAKQCTKCEVVKQLDEYGYKVNGLGKRESRCKECVKAYRDSRKVVKSDYDKKYREVNEEKIKNRTRIWRNENKEELKIKRKKHYEENKEYYLSKCKEWKVNNPEKVRENAKRRSKRFRGNNPQYVAFCNKKKLEHYHRNKEEYALRWKAYYEANKERILESNHKYYRENKERCSQRFKRYSQTEKAQEIFARLRHNRRVRTKDTLTTLTAKQWRDCQKHFDNKCAYCCADGKITKDHFVPVIKGGEFTVRNIIPACESCNRSKRDRDFFDWYPKKSFYSPKCERKILKFLDIKDNQQQIALF